MKKVSLILLLVILASVLLMAATPLKLVRVTFINKSGHVVYLKLEGKVSGQFYYLTIPKGDKTIPEEVTFTLMTDVYTRQMWYGPGDFGCEGVSNKGELWAVQTSKFVFTPCEQIPPNKGEPVWGEKVVYFKWISTSTADLGACYWTVSTKTYKSPAAGCAYLWKY
jgi:hypothetical protein